jgi:beta-galactosidase
MLNRKISIWVGLSALLAALDVAQASERTREKFDYDWRFSKSDPTNAFATNFDDSKWRPLDLPHDWSIEERPDEKLRDGRMSGFFPGGIAWYRKHFTVLASARRLRVIIEFDGVYHRSDVYLNGHQLGHRPYGYVSFQYDLTPHLKFDGENVLAVRVNHSDAPTSRWYSGSGIYRHVWLTTCDPLHVLPWETFITTPEVSSNAATIRIQTAITNENDRAKSCVLTTIIQDPAGNEVASNDSTQEITAGGRSEFQQTVKIANPNLWSPDQPRLYVAKTVVREGDHVRDTYRTTFGIREARFDAQKGFLLNGQGLKLKGVCLHNDAGCLGSAVPERAWERRLEVLKDMGCNGIRLSHNPPAPELLDLCDRMGFLVMDEAFDRWKSGSYYAKYFEQWWQRDLNAMVLRSRCHHCSKYFA